MVALRAYSRKQAIETNAKFAGANTAEVAQADTQDMPIMTTNDRMIKIATANPQTLAAIDAVLNGTTDKPNREDADVRLVTYTEAAKRLNLSRPTVYRLVKLGRLEVVPLDGVNRVRLQSVIDFANGTTRK